MAKDRQESSAYFIHGLELIKLWGYRDLELTFNKDVNVIIGPNASGKTTILNLLRFILTVDFPSLYEIAFDEVVIHLKSFNGASTRTVKVISTERGLKFNVSGQVFDVERELIVPRHISIRRRHFLARPKIGELTEILRDLVPAVWLPVSRRLPIPEEEEEEYRVPRHLQLESVDMRLRELLEGLSRYRLSLEAQLSERYKKFEKLVLEIILYSKSLDRIDPVSITPPTQDDKNRLTEAFSVAGLLDTQMQKRIDEHFSAASEKAKRINEYLVSKEKELNFDDLLIIPLIGRTKSMVQFAGQLEQDRIIIFAPLRRYEEIVNSFLHPKVIRVEENGNLTINTTSPEQKLSPQLLSSGEKQILILLTQALLWEDKPVVYVADEPELSLHVTWQAKFLDSLVDLGKQIQIIVATHSPDIVGPFADKVIDLGSKR